MARSKSAGVIENCCQEEILVHLNIFLLENHALAPVFNRS